MPPAPDLREFVACGWTRTVSGARGVVPIIPDGCSDILVYDDGEPFVAGPDALTRWVSLPDGVAITGLRLRPGALPSVFGCEGRALLGESPLLSEFDRSPLALASTPAARIARLEAWVRGRLERNRDRVVVAACRAIGSNPRVEMDAVADALGWNARMLHRRVTAACGYGPKYLQRILRVQGVIRAAQTSRPLGEVAAMLGFTDQAHLARDFRSITGMTPSAYLAQADPGVGRWLDASWS